MTTESVIDIERLVQPISEESPTGEALTALSTSFTNLSSELDRSIRAEKELRLRLITGAEDDESLPEVKPPDWAFVIDNAIEILSNESKDLRVASWLIQGLMRRNGFSGLRDGLALFDRLCADYWDHIHPAPTEEGHRDTVAQFAGLVGEASITPLTEIPITDSGDDERYTSIDYTEAAELDSINDASVRETRIQEGAIAFDKLEESVRNTNREFYVDLVSDLAVIRSTLTTISDFLDEHCKPDDYGDPTSPSVSSFRSKVDEIKENVERLARHHLEQEEIAEDEMAGNGQLITTEASSSTRMSSGAVINRDDAFEVLRKVADFFARTEPHSPVSYALRQVVEWGKMPLPDLLKELIEDTNTLNELGKRIGVTPPQDEE